MNNFKHIEGGICAATGFSASGTYCGIKKSKSDSSKQVNHKNDICIFKSDALCDTAVVYTKNKVQGAPITVTRQNMNESHNKSIAVIANSKNANTCNSDGIEKAQAMSDLLANELKCDSTNIIVASTGVIGQILPIEPIKSCIGDLVGSLGYDKNNEAAIAIMTTDTFPKESAVEFEIDGKLCHIGGMAKGSGMIHPNMATTLNFITSDCSITSEMLDVALHEVVNDTYNCLSIDGDTSTNDMVSLMSNGLACNKCIDSQDENFEIFKSALYAVMEKLTRLIAKDGEGATKLLECACNGAPNKQLARDISKNVICSNLSKAAFFGEDANWGRILSAIGNTPGDFLIEKIDVNFSSSKGQFDVCHNGFGLDFDENFASKVLSDDEIYININLNQGKHTAKAWGCDLTYDYVKINSDYRS